MRTIASATAILLATATICCGGVLLDARVSSTTHGVTTAQALCSAEVVLSDRGHVVAERNDETGTIRTEWKRRGRRLVSYEVSASRASETATGARGDLEISVSAKVRDRVLDGWSEQYEARMESASIIEDIIERISLGSEKKSYENRPVGRDLFEAEPEDERKSTPRGTLAMKETAAPDAGIQNAATGPDGGTGEEAQ